MGGGGAGLAPSSAHPELPGAAPASNGGPLRKGPAATEPYTGSPTHDDDRQAPHRHHPRPHLTPAALPAASDTRAQQGADDTFEGHNMLADRRRMTQSASRASTPNAPPPSPWPPCPPCPQPWPGGPAQQPRAPRAGAPQPAGGWARSPEGGQGGAAVSEFAAARRKGGGGLVRLRCVRGWAGQLAEVG